MISKSKVAWGRSHLSLDFRSSCAYLIKVKEDRLIHSSAHLVSVILCVPSIMWLLNLEWYSSIFWACSPIFFFKAHVFLEPVLRSTSNHRPLKYRCPNCYCVRFMQVYLICFFQCLKTFSAFTVNDNMEDQLWLVSFLLHAVRKGNFVLHNCLIFQVRHHHVVSIRTHHQLKPMEFVFLKAILQTDKILKFLLECLLFYNMHHPAIRMWSLILLLTALLPKVFSLSSTWSDFHFTIYFMFEASPKFMVWQGVLVQFWHFIMC